MFIDNYQYSIYERTQQSIDEFKKLEIFYKMNNLNIVIYGPKKTGKFNFLMYFLKSYLKIDIKVTTQLTKINDTEIEYQYNKNYFIINPSNYGYNDKNVICELIKELSSTYDISNQQKKIIIIKKVDKISKEAINSLRVIIEKSNKSCIFILLTNNISKINGPILSRCIIVRIAQFKKENIINVIDYIIKNENIKITKKNLGNLYESIKDNDYNTNLNNIILSLENYKITGKFIKYKNPSDLLIEIIEKNIDLKNILLLREKITVFINNNVDLNNIYLDIISYYSDKNYPHINIHEIVELASKFQENSIKGNRDFFHIEAFLINIYYLHHNN